MKLPSPQMLHTPCTCECPCSEDMGLGFWNAMLSRVRSARPASENSRGMPGDCPRGPLRLRQCQVRTPANAAGTDVVELPFPAAGSGPRLLARGGIYKT